MKSSDQPSTNTKETAPLGSESTRSALGILGTKYALLPLSLVISIVVARMLGPADRGIFAVILLIGDTFLPMVAFGSTAGLRYFVASKQYKAGSVLLSAIFLGTVQGLVGLALLVFLWHNELLGNLTSGIPLEMVLPVLLALPLTGMTQHMHRLIVGSSWFTEVNLAQLSRQLVNPLVLGVFVILFDGGIQGAVVAIVAREILNLLIHLGLVLRKTTVSFRFDWEIVKRSYHYGIRGWLGGLARITNSRVDQLILVAVATKAQLGIYAIAVRIVEMLGMTVHSFGMVLFNRISSESDATRRSRVLEQVHRASFVGMVFVGLGVAAVTPWVIPFVLGDAYAEAVPVLMILLPGAVATATWRLLAGYFGATDAPFTSSLGQIVALFVTVPGMLLLMPRFGVGGAAAASSLAYIAAGTVMVLLYRRDQKHRKPRLFSVHRSDFRWMVERLTGAVSVWRTLIAARLNRDV